jgi:sigma-B regulation protein RsbU (phosphoserine phosphatase)
MGLALCMINILVTPIPWALGLAAISGVFAVGWAYAGFRALWKWMLLLGPLQFISISLFSRFEGTHVHALSASAADHAELQRRVAIEGFLMVALVVLGYTLIVTFVRKEGGRFFGQMAEVRLASEVHRALVPQVSRRKDGFEIYGVSMPNGQMGGDLVDVVEGKGGWLAYVADVCGHGVPAGMVMAMVKSATRMGVSEGAIATGFLPHLNQVLKSVSAPNMFVTFAYIAGNSGPDVQFSLAGHLPILHYRKKQGTVEERAISNLPLAISPDAQFDTAAIACAEGDILAVLTDGLTEVSDKEGHELGLENLKAVLLENAHSPLDELMTALRTKASQHGKQLDDQTVLLVRRTEA